jgi:hypothetical protein
VYSAVALRSCWYVLVVRLPFGLLLIRFFKLQNIVPTLIIVRVGLEKTIRDSDEGTKMDTFKAKETSSSV